ncbi:MAG: sigma-70 family RNA polymerase sigma factor, partial [Clostridia bacterium]|nr:sigma-70 family RNA polymerase sigma factor [Clostridia bacterium]
MFLSLFSILAGIPFLALHLTNANSFPRPLSKQEENKYINDLAHNDQNAKDKLIKHNLRLVAHIAKKYYSEKIEFDDLISIGTIGLIKAVNTFKPSKNIKLSSYASRCIENEILMYFRTAKKSSLDVSINEPIETDKNGNTLTLMDTISTGDTILDTINTKINIQKLNKYLVKNLSPRERIIVCMRYGICGFRPL